MDVKHQRVALNNGHSIPALGFGTYAPDEVPKSEACKATKIAIDVGFRHIDASHVYQNEKEVGQAIRSKIADGTVKREDIFYTSKLWCTFLRPELVRIGLEQSLKALQLDYVDLYIIHFPAAMKVECHPYLNQSKLLDFCKSKDIVLVAYGALGSSRDPKWVDQSFPVLLEDPVVCSLAKKYKQSPALIVLRYQLQRGVVVLAKSFIEKEIKENIQVFGFQLSSEDMKVLDGLNRNFRYYRNDFLADHPDFPFSDEY